MTRSSFLFLSVFVLLRSPAALGAQAPGLQPEWDIRQTLAVLIADSKRLDPMLAAVKPEEWVAKGAPEAYVEQWKALRNEIGYLRRSAEELAKKPERLSMALETYLRLQAIDAMMRSFTEGVRRYYNPAVADLLMGVMDENAASAGKLRDYLVELAANLEAELQIADKEAQRCRSTLINQPAPRRQRP
jgi:hypothetical protein